MTAEERVPGWVLERFARLEARIEQLKAENALLKAENTQLRAENAELRRQLARTSKTSHRPPSSDGPRKAPRPAVPREPGKRRPGKQPGDSGASLATVADPDARVVHQPAACDGCGASLLLAPVVGVARRQVHELPEIRLHVTEHVAEQRQCGCGEVTCGSFPAGVTGRAVYGPRVLAVAGLCLVDQHLPVARTSRLLGDLLGAPLATGTLAGLIGRVAGTLDGFRTRVRALLHASPVVHVDETGARVAGRGQWVHSASTPALTWQTVHAKRGRAGIDACGILPDYRGVAVHDDWKPYRTYGQAAHALCGAHLLRDLAAIADLPGQTWTGAMRTVLLDGATATRQARTDGHAHLDPATRTDLHTRYQHALDQGFHANGLDDLAKLLHGPRVKRPPPVRLLLRLTQRREEVLHFTRDLRVPFTNNQAERDVRMVKLHQKISGSWRTPTGASAFLTVRSYTATARKHGHSVLTALHDALTGQPWLPPEPTPA